MNAIDILLDLASRPRDTLKAIATSKALTVDTANWRPEGHPNSAAWLLWHTGREVDMQLAALTTQDELWEQQGYRGALKLGNVGDTLGYGHSAEDAAAIRITETENLDTLINYADTALAQLADYCRTLTEAELGEVITEYEGAPITRGTRLVSIIDDAIAHLAQVAYITGMNT